jgi:hypothetical protein
MAAQVTEDCRDLFLRQFFDQAEQLLALRAHGLSVRRLSRAGRRHAGADSIE